jgi:hypothetical protein
MECQNIKCRYYRAPAKRELWEINCGVKKKLSGCSFSYCKQKVNGKESRNNREVLHGLLLDFMVYCCIIIYFYW